jgi:membrane-bound lytic murein transglycosylase A
MLLRVLAAALAAATAASCTWGPRSLGTGGTRPSETLVEDFALAPRAFATLPGWRYADLAPALTALRRHCESWRGRPPEMPLGGGRYGGTIGDWLPVCTAAPMVSRGNERTFFETYFALAEVSGSGESRLTAYYEPVIPARRTPQPPFTEPLLRPPPDMVMVDLEAFRQVREDDALRGAPRLLTGRVRDGRVEPYPKREAISKEHSLVIAYAHPADVYNLQVQGSGRLRFGDGSETRAAYAAQNGYRWRSALSALRRRGAIRDPSWRAFRGWLDANPERAAEVLNADPSYVFFEEEPIADVAAGPRGAAGVPLTPLGSVAVDPAYHPYGAVVFVDGTYEGAPFRRLMVAQDTGGAIRRGPQRGDVFFGSGARAGESAERMNGVARWWTLLPRGRADAVASARDGLATPEEQQPTSE